MWLNVVALGGMDAFRDLADAVVRGDAAWRAWYDAEAPERAPVPGYEERLSKFERTCIVKARCLQQGKQKYDVPVHVRLTALSFLSAPKTG